MTALTRLSACDMMKRIRSGDLSPVELVHETIKRIEAVNPSINAFVSLRPEGALLEAKALEKRLARGAEPGPLAGIPIGVKDLEDVEGMVTSFGSVPYKDNVAVQDSIQVRRLRAAGAIVVGKTNTPEFGFTGFTKNRLYGITRNPWNVERTPGGSSGGSAAAVAAHMVPLATGSDAGGSIRIPASYTGCFGLKPSYGRVPLGPVPIINIFKAFTLGPISRTVEDAALYMDCVSGYHPSDPDSLPAPGASYVGCLRKAPGPLKIAYSPDLGYARVQRDVAAAVEKAVKAFEDMGHSVDVWTGTFPDVSDAWADFMNGDCYAPIHEDLDKNRAEMGRTLVQALDSAKKLTFPSILLHQETRTALNETLWKLFDEYDLLLTPTMPTEAFGAKGPPPTHIEGEPIPILRAVAFTYPFNLSGHPGATVRAGFTDMGLPAGLQIVGPRQREDRVLQAAYAYEQVRPWNDFWPEV